MKKCPYPHLHIPTPEIDVIQETGDTTKYSSVISWIFRQLKSGVEILIDSPEKEQALYAYRIYQFAEQWDNLNRFMDGIIQTMEEESDTYKNLSKEMGEFLKKYGKNFFKKIEKDTLVQLRLCAWLETFHAFIKRAVLFAEKDSDWNRIFPYTLAQQFASTAMGRANYMAAHPEIRGWEWLFFDPTIDVSKQFLGLETWRPIYRCPVLYSWKFRELTDMYFTIMCRLHTISVDQPKQVDWKSDDYLE
jgi:hypothetical protein